MCSDFVDVFLSDILNDSVKNLQELITITSTIEQGKDNRLGHELVLIRMEDWAVLSLTQDCVIYQAKM